VKSNIPKRFHRAAFFNLLLGLALMYCPVSAASGADITLTKDVEYAHVGERSLKLDIYRPGVIPEDRDHHSFLIVWVHGGAWRSGSKESMPLGDLVKVGYVVASVDYRLSPEAKFPAQVHDIKAAIRFLRAHADDYGYRKDRIAIAGSSAGGHLAALVGVTNGHQELEGEVGECLDQSSNISAIIDLYGPTNFMTILEQSTPHGLSVRVPALELLIGDDRTNMLSLRDLRVPPGMSMSTIRHCC